MATIDKIVLTDENETEQQYTHEHRVLTILLSGYIRDNITTPQKIDTIIRCAVNYGHACIPLWEWRNRYEVMKKEAFATIYQKYKGSNDDKYYENNIKKLFQLALRYDDDDENCKKLYHMMFPQEDREARKQIKEQKRQVEDELREEKKLKKQEKREQEDKLREDKKLIKQQEQERKQEKEKEEKEEEELEKQRKYEDMKDDFEEKNFKCADTFYEIFENKLRPYTKQGFMTKYQNYRIDKKTPFLDMWFIDANIREYDKIDFIPPPIKSKSNIFNTWNLIEQFDECEIDEELDTGIFHKFFKHLCGKEENVYEYFIKYIAQLLQFPAIKPEVCLFFTGSQGGGKDTTNFILSKLIGEEAIVQDPEPENIFGKYNWCRMNKLVVCLQETDNIKSYSGKIKDLITCKTTNIADKNVKNIKVNDYSRLIIFSNNENIINIEPSDRRFVVIKTWNFHYDPQPELFKELYKAINNPDMINKFRKELLSYDIEEDFNFQRNRPITEIYRDLKEVNTPSIIRWAWDISLAADKHEISGAELCRNYNEWCKNAFGNEKEINSKSFGLNIKKYFYINKEWIGFEKKITNSCSKYTINNETLKNIIEEQYGYTGEI